MTNKSKTAAAGSKSSTAHTSQPAREGGESVQGYFRGVFKENRKLIWERSNDVLFERWLRDHPGEKDVPERVKQLLANLKSVLRRKLARRGRRNETEVAEAAANGAHAALASPALRGLDRLEAQIDDALTLAKHLDRDRRGDAGVGSGMPYSGIHGLNPGFRRPTSKCSSLGSRKGETAERLQVQPAIRPSRWPPL